MNLLFSFTKKKTNADMNKVEKECDYSSFCP